MSHIPRLLLAAGSAMALVLLPACQSPRSSGAIAFPSPTPGWKTSVGQLRYSTPQRAVIGEAVVSRDGTGNFQLDFVAGPGVPLMSLRENDTAVRAEGLFARGSWSGTPSRAGRLSSWVKLREVFTALDSSPTAASPAGTLPVWTAKSDRSGTGRRITVEYPKTKERFVFVFTR